MDGFVFFLIFLFVIVPIFKNIVSGKSTKKPRQRTNRGHRPKPTPQKNWAQIQELLQQKIEQQSQKTQPGRRDKHGHSDARQNTHQRLHARDENTNVFPEDHLNRVRKRDQRDRSERNRIETMIHNKKNQAIVRDSNNGLDSWGARGDRSSSNNLAIFLVVGVVIFFIIAQITPEFWSQIKDTLNIK